MFRDDRDKNILLLISSHLIHRSFYSFPPRNSYTQCRHVTGGWRGQMVDTFSLTFHVKDQIAWPDVWDHAPTWNSEMNNVTSSPCRLQKQACVDISPPGSGRCEYPARLAQPA